MCLPVLDSLPRVQLLVLKVRIAYFEHLHNIDIVLLVFFVNCFIASLSPGPYLALDCVELMRIDGGRTIIVIVNICIDYIC